MTTNTVFKILSAVVLLAVVAMIAVEKIDGLSWGTLPADLKQLIEERASGTESVEPVNDESWLMEPTASIQGRNGKSEPYNETGFRKETDNPSDSANATANDGGRLVVGAMGATPTIDQIHSIGEVPWQESQVNRAFNQSKDFACKLLLPETAVKPPLTRLPIGRRGVMGRMAAVTVGLEIDSAADLKLPTASAGAIREYLTEHRLAIEPIVFQDEKGNAYFGTDCRAAFYKNASPTSTIKAEPLIDEAIGKFRAIGVLREGENANGRTLVMAFRYVDSTQKDGLVSAKPKDVTELLFLHLSESSSDKLPKLEVFATTNSRQNLHRLVTAAESVIQDPLPTISASIRFDSFILMGLYPAKPVVTGIRLRSSGVISIDTIMKLTQTGSEKDRVSFQSLLDQFAIITNG
ncbi:MAG TPA: hypothetical protein DDZ51_09755 [Planctomycetaceae bacterium]|nr:hypothetical protein [Planctomycetaceae bacterium]